MTYYHTSYCPDHDTVEPIVSVTSGRMIPERDEVVTCPGGRSHGPHEIHMVIPLGTIQDHVTVKCGRGRDVIRMSGRGPETEA